MSARESSLAADLVSRALRRADLSDRGRFLRDLLAHAAAGLTLIEGERAAAEAVYRIADALVDRRRG